MIFRPTHEFADWAGVYHAVGGHAAQCRALATIAEPVELAGCVRIGVDGEDAALLQGQRMSRLGGSRRSGRQLISTAFPCSTHASKTASASKRLSGRRTPGSVPLVAGAVRGHLATSAVAQDVEVRIGDRGQHPLRHHVFLIFEAAMHRADHDVQTFQQFVSLIEGAVGKDVDLDAGEDAEPVGQLRIDIRDQIDLVA